MLEKINYFFNKYRFAIQLALILMLVVGFFVPIINYNAWYIDDFTNMSTDWSPSYFKLITYIYNHRIAAPHYLVLWDILVFIQMIIYACLILIELVNLIMVICNKKPLIFTPLFLFFALICFQISQFAISDNIDPDFNAVTHLHIGFYILLCLFIGLLIYYISTHPIRRAKAYIGNVREKLAAKRAEREASRPPCPLTDKERIEQLEQQVKELSDKVKK